DHPRPQTPATRPGRALLPPLRARISRALKPPRWSSEGRAKTPRPPRLNAEKLSCRSHPSSAALTAVGDHDTIDRPICSRLRYIRPDISPGTHLGLIRRTGNVGPASLSSDGR